MTFSSFYQVMAVQQVRKNLLFGRGRDASTALYQYQKVSRPQASGQTSVSLALTEGGESVDPFITELQTQSVLDIWEQAFSTEERALASMQRYIDDLKEMEMPTFLRHIHPDGKPCAGIPMILLKVDLACEGGLNPWCQWGLKLFLTVLAGLSQVKNQHVLTSAMRKADQQKKLKLFYDTQLCRFDHEYELFCAMMVLKSGGIVQLIVESSGRDLPLDQTLWAHRSPGWRHRTARWACCRRPPRSPSAAGALLAPQAPSLLQDAR